MSVDAFSQKCSITAAVSSDEISPTTSGTRALFFKALKSARRQQNTASINRLIAQPMSQLCHDPQVSTPELDKFVVYAGDGHYDAAAAKFIRWPWNFAAREVPWREAVASVKKNHAIFRTDFSTPFKINSPP